MLSGHVKEALERAESSEGEYVIAPQDTTYYNYSGQSQMSGLGKIQGKIKGVMQHNVLLLNEKGLPRGMLAQQYWTRHGGMDWPEGEKESQKCTYRHNLLYLGFLSKGSLPNKKCPKLWKNSK